MPLTAAMTGFQRSFDFGPMYSPGSSSMNGLADPAGPPVDSACAPISPGSSGQSPIISVRSMPVQNARSPAAGEHRAVDVVVRRRPRQSRCSSCVHLGVERVVHLGAVQRHPRDAVRFLVDDGLEVGHACPPGVGRANGSVPSVALDVRGRIDRIADRFPPLKYALEIQDRYGQLHGNVSANSITLTAFLALFAVTLLAVAVIGYVDATNVDVAKSITQWLGLSGDAAQVVTDAVSTTRTSTRFATVVGFIGVITIGTSFAGSIATSYNIAWGVRNRGLIERLRSLAWLAVFGVLTVASIWATTLWTRWSTELSFLVVAITMVTNGLLWLFTSWWLPNRKVSFRAMLPAAAAHGDARGAEGHRRHLGAPADINASAGVGRDRCGVHVIAWILFFGRVVVYVTVIEVLEAERIGEKKPHPTLLP